jgi:hypothetical protein
MSDYPRKVVAAACQTADGRIVCGVRHYDELMLASILCVAPDKVAETMKGIDVDQMDQAWRSAEQGFVDNRYKFLTREQAYKVALAANQFDPNDPGYGGIRGTLFSEDVW